MTAPHPRIRTFHARHGRMTPALAHALDHLGWRYGVPDGPIDPVVVFGRTAPFVVEVGSGHGAAAVAYARTHPGHDVLAVEVHRPGVATLLASIREHGLANVRVVTADALDVLDHRLGTASIDGVHLFFPDPWPKARHAKRRFVRPDIVDVVADRLRTGGEWLIATDWPDYVDQVLDVLGTDDRFTGGVSQRPPWRPRVGYEHRAVLAGRTPVELRYQRL